MTPRFLHINVHVLSYDEGYHNSFLIFQLPQ